MPDLRDGVYVGRPVPGINASRGARTVIVQGGRVFAPALLAGTHPIGLAIAAIANGQPVLSLDGYEYVPLDWMAKRSHAVAAVAPNIVENVARWSEEEACGKAQAN